MHPASPLRAWSQLREKSGASFSEAWSVFASVKGPPPTVTGPHSLHHPLRDFFEFTRHGPGVAQARCGEFTVLPEGERILDGIVSAGVATGALTNKLGGTFATPRFRVETDFISIRAWGGGGAQVRLIMDGYPIGNGGTHPRLTLDKGEPTWIKMDVKYRRGSWAYLEFSTAEDLTRQDGKFSPRSWFGVSEIIAHDGELPHEAAASPLLAGDVPASPAELADHQKYLKRINT